MSVVGTAGHVDHGKSTLLERITGRDPDRWEEEKQRGLTIDLGFVWTTLPSGRQVSFVDVPGHERFIKNMLAGIEAIDLALLVVAADEGWMPQTEEHVAVLDLLEIRSAIVAITKTDRVDADLVELAALETSERLEGSTLQGSAVIPVSAVSGAGIDELVAALDQQLGDEAEGDDPHLWVDRKFSVSGVGTVVTGTLLGGATRQGAELQPYPGGQTVRVRGIESHEMPLAAVGPGRRVALNLAGDTESIGRGTLLARPDSRRPTDRLLAKVEAARHTDGIPDRGSFHVHTGTAAVPARLRWLGGGTALIRLDTPVPLRYGDRFIIRDSGRRAVVAGGSVTDPRPGKKGQEVRQSAGVTTDLTPGQAADALLEVRGVANQQELTADTGGTPSRGVSSGDDWLSTGRHHQLGKRIDSAVAAYHDEYPLRPGLPLATLASQLNVSRAIAQHLVESSSNLSLTEGVVAVGDRTTTLTPEQEDAWSRAEERLVDSGFNPPRLAELAVDPELVHSLVRQGRLVQISEDLVYLPETIERLVGEIRDMPGEFTVADFRDKLEVSRKYAVPILEWADGQAMTIRTGDKRRAR